MTNEPAPVSPSTLRVMARALADAIEEGGPDVQTLAVHVGWLERAVGDVLERLGVGDG